MQLSVVLFCLLHLRFNGAVHRSVRGKGTSCGDARTAPHDHLTEMKKFGIYIYFLAKTSWSGTSYCRIHFLPFTRDGRGYAQYTPFINLWTY